MTPRFEFLMSPAVDVGDVVSMGAGPLGERRNKTIAVATAERKTRQVLLTAYKLL
jgi:hypothetical protein